MCKFAALFDTTMITYENLTSQLKEKKFKPIYLLHGEEPFYIDRICKFFENFVLEEEERDFNQAILFGKDVTAADVIANAKQFPFGSPFRVVILKEAKDLSDFDLLKAYAKDPTETTILVICYKYKKLTAAQCKPYEQHGVVFESVGVQDYNLDKWILSNASRFRFQLDSNTASVLAEHIGNDLSRIYSEFEKLRVIMPNGGTLTADIIEKYIGISKEYNIFELEDALSNHNVEKAYKIALNFGQHAKDHPNIVTIATLFNYYHNMLRYHLSDKSDEAVKVIFGRMGWKLVPIAQRHTVPQLTKIISILREYDMKSKGVDNNCNDGELLKEMVYKILH